MLSRVITNRSRRHRIVARAGGFAVAAGKLLESLGDLDRVLVNLATPLAPGIGKSMEHLSESRHAELLGWRPIGSGKKRLPIMIQKDAHRPTAATGHHLDRIHVDLVNVRPFLPIDLDRDEVLIEESGDLGIFKTLSLHHVAPVAGSVSDRQKDRLVGFPRQLESLVTPGKPIHWIVLVLQQVRTQRFGQTIQNVLQMGKSEWLGTGISRKKGADTRTRKRPEG